MVFMVIGLALFTLVHLFPCVAPDTRGQLVGRLGENAYKGIFSLLILLGIISIVVGWRSTLPTLIYLPPAGLVLPAKLVILLGVLLIVAANLPSRIKQFLRHPQLTGVLIWSIGHLLANGDNRSVIVFGTLAVWCIVSILAINRRDGAWEKPEPEGLAVELKLLVGTAVVAGLMIYFHQYLSGIPLLT